MLLGMQTWVSNQCTEAPFFPGVLFYLSKWYTKKEMNLRMSIFYSGALIAGAFGNLIAAGILNGMDGKRGISAWRWLYIIEGTSKYLFPPKKMSRVVGKKLIFGF